MKSNPSYNHFLKKGKSRKKRREKGGEGEERESKRHEKERDVVATVKIDKSMYKVEISFIQPKIHMIVYKNPLVAKKTYFWGP